jgi:hypothetical protein
LLSSTSPFIKEEEEEVDRRRKEERKKKRFMGLDYSEENTNVKLG